MHYSTASKQERKEERDVFWLSTNCLISLTLSWKNKHSPGPLKHSQVSCGCVTFSGTDSSSNQTTEVSYLPHTGFATEAYTSSTRGQWSSPHGVTAYSDLLSAPSDTNTPESANEGSEKCLVSRFRCVGTKLCQSNKRTLDCSSWIWQICTE